MTNRIGGSGLPRDGIWLRLEAVDQSTQWQEGVDTTRLAQELGNHTQLLGKPELPIKSKLSETLILNFLIMSMNQVCVSMP